jgi:hypothetical protein
MGIDLIEILFYNGLRLLEHYFCSYKESIMGLFSSKNFKSFPGSASFKNFRFSPSLIFGGIILIALLAFESFNYSTTEYALSDLLGNLKFAGFAWATILAIAFCGIDFAGIARLFTPEQAGEEPKEIWYLFGAWILAATMNAILTWWGVSMAIASHSVQSTAVMDSRTLTYIVPVFVAIMVWVIRILIIGTISVAGDRLLWGRPHRSVPSAPPRPLSSTSSGRSVSTPLGVTSAAPRPASAFPRTIEAASASHPEPTYHSLSQPRPASSSLNTSTNTSQRRF